MTKTKPERRFRFPGSLSRRFTKKTAEELKLIIEKIIYFRDNDIPVDKRTLVWIETAPEAIKDKLAGVGLIEARHKITCSQIWDAYLEEKTGVKENTIKTYEQTKNEFFLFFEKGAQINKLNSCDFLEWKKELKKKGVSEATIALYVSRTKTLFNNAVRNKWIITSPLTGVGIGSYENPENDQFIELNEYNKLLQACPCQEWRTIITLSRIGGLRCSSEVLKLRWDDIYWDKDMFKVNKSQNRTSRRQGLATHATFSGNYS